jgi:predicted nuclease of predicted toxin-antitoxin system
VVRLLLDANLSPKRIGSVLEKDGHDVLSLASDAALGALDDPQVLELAAEQDRIVVTRNSRDFAPLLRQWSEAGRHHAGCILIWTLGHHEFGAIINGVSRLLRDRPNPEEWRDLAVAL